MWSISGSNAHVTLGANSRGYLAIACPEAKSRIRLHTEQAPISFVLRLQEAEMSWLVLCGSDLLRRQRVTSAAEHEERDSELEQLIAFYSEDSARSAVSIYLRALSEEDLFPRATVLLPRATFRGIWRLFGQLLSQPALRYEILVDFLGFRAEQADVPEPSYPEFRRGRPILSRDVSITFRSVTEMDNGQITERR